MTLDIMSAHISQPKFFRVANVDKKDLLITLLDKVPTEKKGRMAKA